MSELDHWSERRRRIAMRPDAHLAMRPDAHRFMPSQPPRWATKDEVRLFWGGQENSAQAVNRADQAAIAAEFDELLQLRRELEEVKALIQLRRELRDLKAYNPNQPRVLAGTREGGQWTSEGATGSPVRLAGPIPRRSPERFGTNFPGSTYGQQLRLDQAIARTQDALSRIRRYDPDWRPRTSSARTLDGIEGAIRDAEARAAEAEAHLNQLRFGIGGNLGPPLESVPRSGVDGPALRSFDGPAWIGAYRAVNNMPDLFGRPMWPFDKGTVAVTEIDGQLVFGVNSKAPGYSDADWNLARRTRDILIDKYPSVLGGENSGEVPNDSFFHAESTILFRAAEINGGTLAGRTLQVHIDRDLCDSCKNVLPLLGTNLGEPTVIFVNGKTGSTWLLRNSEVRKIK